MPSGTTADGKGDLGASDAAFRYVWQARHHRRIVFSNEFSALLFAIVTRTAFQAVCHGWPLLKGNPSSWKLSVATLKTSDHDRGQKKVGADVAFPLPPKQ